MAKTLAQPHGLQMSGTALDLAAPRSDAIFDSVPDYLRTHYWWAYIDPRAVKFFERQWLVNLILWGNYGKLRDAALEQLGGALPGSTLQVACAYGDLTNHLAERTAAGGGSLDIVDVLPIQLENLRDKLPTAASIRLLSMNSAVLHLPDGSYDRALLFFLLHEQPANVRRQTLREVFRVVKPGGKIVIVDFAQPRWWHPLRYLWRPVLAKLEPFALDLWRDVIGTWIPAGGATEIESRAFFGGFYRMTTFTRRQHF